MVLVHLVHIDILNHGKNAGMHGPRVFATKALAQEWVARILYGLFGGPDNLYHKDTLLDWQLDPADFECVSGDRYQVPAQYEHDYAFMETFVDSMYDEEPLPVETVVHFDEQELEFPSLDEEPPRKKSK
jgi:hypothetical protein